MLRIYLILHSKIEKKNKRFKKKKLNYLKKDIFNLTCTTTTVLTIIVG